MPDQPLFAAADADRAERLRQLGLACRDARVSQACRWLVRLVYEQTAGGLHTWETETAVICGQPWGPACSESRARRAIGEALAAGLLRGGADLRRGRGYMVAIDWAGVWACRGLPAALAPESAAVPVECGPRAAAPACAALHSPVQPCTGKRSLAQPCAALHSQTAETRLISAHAGARPLSLSSVFSVSDVDDVRDRQDSARGPVALAQTASGVAANWEAAKTRANLALRRLWPAGHGRPGLRRDRVFLLSVAFLAGTALSEVWFTDAVELAARESVRNKLGFLRTVLVARLYEFEGVCPQGEAAALMGQLLAAVRGEATRLVAGRAQKSEEGVSHVGAQQEA